MQWRPLKERHLRYTLRVPGLGVPLNAIHFDGWRGQAPAMRVRLAYRLARDDYRGGEAI